MKKFIFTFLLLLATVSPAWADRYYCLIFAYDSKPVPLPCLSHVWGTFVQVSDNGKMVKEVTISWEPDGVSYIDFSRPGMNSPDSLNFAVKNNRKVCMWGPFTTSKSTFDKAEIQYAKGGKYKFIDGCWRSASQNCIHRLSDIAGPHKTGIYWGWWAGESVMKHFQRQGIIEKATNGDSIMLLLGYSKYPIIRK